MAREGASDGIMTCAMRLLTRLGNTRSTASCSSATTARTRAAELRALLLPRPAGDGYLMRIPRFLIIAVLTI